MVEEANVEPIDPMEKERGGRKRPLVSGEKYDDEVRTEFIEEEKTEVEEAKVEPIRPSEQRGGKKKGLLDTCK